MIDEESKRRPTFQPGRTVVLADGQPWMLPLPRVRCVPDEGPVGFRVVLGLAGDDYQGLVDAHAAAQSGGEVIRAELALARRLLLQNYDLAPAEVAGLIQFAYGPEAAADDPDGARMREEVMAVATGQGPKPSGDTDASSPLPTVSPAA